MVFRRMGVLGAVMFMHGGMVWALLPNGETAPAKAQVTPVLETVILDDAKPQSVAPLPLPVAPAKPRPTVVKSKQARPVAQSVSKPAESSAVTAEAEAPAAMPAAAAVPVASSAPSVRPRDTIRQPAVITCRIPAYPPESRRAREIGTVQLQLLIDVEGEVIDKRVETSSGFARLDEAALTALAKCKFQPGSVDGRSEPTWARLRYRWTLD